jgi:GAF domain-containing protein
MKQFGHQEIIPALQEVLQIEQRVSGLEYLRQFAKNIAQTFASKYVLIGHAIKPDYKRVQTDVVWADKDFFDNFVYDLKDTPCENVLSGNRVCLYTSDVAHRFPKDKLLAEMGVESYIGAPMVTVDGKLSGILVLLDDEQIIDTDFYSAIVEFLAVRAGTELERYFIEENLKQQVSERTIELERSNNELQKALSEIKTLRGIVPICSKCKKIRDDKGFWQQVETYVSQHSDAFFSHAICPECVNEYYNELDKLKK